LERAFRVRVTNACSAVEDERVCATEARSTVEERRFSAASAIPT
jgi:hypothetical protein